MRSHESVRRNESFAFETTLSGRGYAQAIPLWKTKGYRIILFYLSLPDVKMAIARVAARVAQGGHSIPEDVIRRRFNASLRNYNECYKALVTSWVFYDNAGEKPVLMDRGGEM